MFKPANDDAELASLELSNEQLELALGGNGTSAYQGYTAAGIAASTSAQSKSKGNSSNAGVSNSAPYAPPLDQVINDGISGLGGGGGLELVDLGGFFDGGGGGCGG
jgi:hypothetical protein